MYDVDIVILSLNRTDLTIETIQNVLKQQNVSFKVWVIDQGSSDENIHKLRNIAAAYPTLLNLEELGKNHGVPGGRNIGARLGSGEIVVNVDNDAEFASPRALADVVHLFQEDPSLGAVGFRVKNYYTNQDDELSWAYPKAQKQQRESPFTTTRFAGGASAIRRAAFKQAGGFDAKLFFYWEELDFSYQIINLGYKITYYPEIIVLHKVSPELRVNWHSTRYYYYARNAVWINFKYYQSFLSTIGLTIGYLLKGILNRVSSQAIRGCTDGLIMCLTSYIKGDLHPYLLNKKARQYVKVHDLNFRGSLVKRIQNEVLTKLPNAQ